MITRRGLVNGVLQAPLSGEKAIRALFNNGEQGVWYDPSDLSTLFQDAAGTTPVTAVGQPVGLMLDKSGRGNHATQVTAASRPVLQQDANGRMYLACDGVDDGMATASIDFTATDKMAVWVGVNVNTTANQRIITIGSYAENGTMMLSVNEVISGSIAVSRANPTTNYIFESLVQTVPRKICLCAELNGAIATSGGGAALNIYNTVVTTSAGGSNAMPAFTNAPLHLFKSNTSSLFLNGNFYGLVIRGASSTSRQVLQVMKYLANKTGV